MRGPRKIEIWGAWGVRNFFSRLPHTHFNRIAPTEMVSHLQLFACCKTSGAKCYPCSTGLFPQNKGHALSLQALVFHMNQQQDPAMCHLVAGDLIEAAFIATYTFLPYFANLNFDTGTGGE